MKSQTTSSVLSSAALLAVLLPLGLALSACLTGDLDVSSEFQSKYSIADYQTNPTWYKTEVAGPAPGHSESFRVIYANDVARSYSHVGTYPEGSIMVKDIFALDGEGQGAYDYTAVMRKIAPEDAAAEGLEIEGGWLFTFFEESRDSEVTIALCWHQCHVQAPIDGSWYDYGL